MNDYYRFDGRWFRADCAVEGKTDPPTVPTAVALYPVHEQNLPTWVQQALSRYPIFLGDIAVWYGEYPMVAQMVNEERWAVWAYEAHLRRNEFRAMAGAPPAPVPTSIRRNLVVPRKGDQTVPPFSPWNSAGSQRYLAALEGAMPGAKPTVPMVDPAFTMRDLERVEQGEAWAQVMDDLIPPGLYHIEAVRLVALMWLSLTFGRHEDYDRGFLPYVSPIKGRFEWLSQATTEQLLPGFQPAEPEQLGDRQFVHWYAPSGDTPVTVPHLLQTFPLRRAVVHPKLPGFVVLVDEAGRNPALWGPPALAKKVS